MKTLMLMVTLASAHLIRGAANVNAVDVNAGAFEAAQRKLEGTCTLTTETHYFEVSIRIQPDGTQNQYGECAVQDQVVLGHDLNTMLLDYVRYEPLTPAGHLPYCCTCISHTTPFCKQGIGDAGSDDNGMFLAGVCPQPDMISAGTSRALKYRQPHNRELWWSPWKWWGYYFLGGGGCRGCNYDNNDRRDLQYGAVVGTTEWFQETFAPELQLTLEDAIANTLVSAHTSCLGSDPMVNVTLIEVDFDALSLQCDGGTFVEELATMNLGDIAFKEQHCGLCHSIDFSTKGDGTPLVKGDYVRDEWKAPLHGGLTITASGGLNQARIFDTADTVCTNDAGRSDFGSPNKACGGIGEGAGGEPGQPGANCVPLKSKFVLLVLLRVYDVHPTGLIHIPVPPFSLKTCWLYKKPTRRAQMPITMVAL